VLRKPSIVDISPFCVIAGISNSSLGIFNTALSDLTLQTSNK
jgi:hypothetical protein